MVAILLWAEPARIVRTPVLSLRQRTHLVAARTFGARSPYLIRRHILPAVMPLLVAQFVRAVRVAILFEVALSFSGSATPVRPELGQHDPVRDGRAGLPPGACKWWIVPPGLSVALVVCRFAFVGLGLRNGWTAASPRAPPG